MPHNASVTSAGGAQVPQVSIPFGQIVKGIARDVGWECPLPGVSLPVMLGLDNILAVERHIPQLMRTKSLRLDMKAFTQKNTSTAKKAPPGVEWYWRVGNLLGVAPSGVRLSEPVQAIYDVAVDKGFLSAEGRTLPAAEVWRTPTDDALPMAQEFFDSLKQYYGCRTFQEACRYRSEQAEHNLSQQLALTDYLLVEHEAVRVIALDFCLDSAHGYGDFPRGFCQDLVIACRENFLDSIRFMSVFREMNHGYLWHVSFNRVFGYYIRFLFFGEPGGPGSHEKFVARASRVWQQVTNGIGCCIDLRKNPNELARVGGVVDGNNVRSVTKLQKAVTYQIEKDKRFRILGPKKLHVFGHSEMAGLDMALLQKAWMARYAHSLDKSGEQLAMLDARLNRLSGLMAQKAVNKKVPPILPYGGVGGHYVL